MLQKSRTKKSKISAPLIMGIFAFLSFILFIVNSHIAIEYMKKGLNLCAATVIPSLFPFMIISELLMSSGLGAKLGRLLSKPAKTLFGVNEGPACAFLLGIICGFPIGAKSISSMLDRHEISVSEAERALTFCNNPGSAFVISAVGVSLFGSSRLGWILYSSLLISAMLVGIVGRFFFKPHIDRSNIISISVSHKKNVGAEMFTDAVKSSAASMLTVCALVAFFSSLIGSLGAILEQLGAPQQVSAAIFCIFELSSGASAAADLSAHPTAAILLTSAALGWSGLSVHFQVISVTAGRGISYKPYFIAKGAQGILCAAISAITLKLLPFSEEVFKEITLSNTQKTYANAKFVCFVFLFASILPIFTHKTRQNPCKKSNRKFF